MPTDRPTPALTRQANHANLLRSIAKAKAMREASIAAAATAAEQKALRQAGPTTPHPGIPPMTGT